MKQVKYISNGIDTYAIIGQQGKQGPQGKQGEQGPQGKQGPQGPQGEAAPAETVREVINEAITNGTLSAYDDTEIKHAINYITDSYDPVDTVFTESIDTTFSQGYVNNAGESSTSNDQYGYTDHISVKEGDVIYISGTNKSGDLNYEKIPMRFGCAYNGSNVIEESGWTSAKEEYVVPVGINSVVLSVDVKNYSNHIVKKNTTKKVSKRVIKDSVNSPQVVKMLDEYKKVSSKVLGGEFLSNSSEELTSGNSIYLEENCISKNKVLSCCFNVNSIGDGIIRIGHGKTTYNASYIEIDSTNVSIYKYSWQKELQKQQSHGLTISGYVMVKICVGNDNKEKLSLMTSNGLFKLDGIYWTGRSGKIFAEADNCTINDVKLNWYCNDYKKSIYAFGDSYFEVTGDNRWTAYLIANGHDNLLLDHFGGRKAEKAYTSFVNSISHGTPKYALWCMGQNDPDSTETGINTSWKTATDNFVNKCKENGIIPILSTIPNVRGGKVDDTNIDATRTHNYKNDYIKSLGLRYIDFAKAVGAYDDNNWYSGMLSSDGVHPDVLGAKALYMQAIIDFPELMYEN